jgi:hypothetical protein
MNAMQLLMTAILAMGALADPPIHRQAAGLRRSYCEADFPSAAWQKDHGRYGASGGRPRHHISRPDSLPGG